MALFFLSSFQGLLKLRRHLDGISARNLENIERLSIVLEITLPASYFLTLIQKIWKLLLTSVPPPEGNQTQVLHCFSGFAAELGISTAEQGEKDPQSNADKLKRWFDEASKYIGDFLI